ncbi:hypothetical protein EJ08DRAFT_644334, partial [Tothia fuscella]
MKTETVYRSTISCCKRGKYIPRDQYIESKYLISTTQQKILVKHINQYTNYSIPPTVEIFPRFLKRWSDTLDSSFLSTIDKNRQAIDNYTEYRVYFNKVEIVIRKYRVLPQNTYNIDEKGFLIGLLQKSKR